METQKTNILAMKAQANTPTHETGQVAATTSATTSVTAASAPIVSSDPVDVIASVSLFAPPLSADTLADALVAGQLSPRTRRAYASDLAELLSVLDAGNVGLPAVTRDHLNAYRAWLAGESVPGLEVRPPCAPASVSRKVSVARQFFAEAESRSLIPVNPAIRLRGF